MTKTSKKKKTHVTNKEQHVFALLESELERSIRARERAVNIYNMETDYLDFARKQNAGLSAATNYDGFLDAKPTNLSMLAKKRRTSR